MTGPKGWKEGRQARTSTGSFGRFQLHPSHLITENDRSAIDTFVSQHTTFDGRRGGEHRHQAMVLGGIAADLPEAEQSAALAEVLGILGFEVP